MSDTTNLVPDENHLSRRHFVAGASALMAGLGVAGTFGFGELATKASAASTTSPEDAILEQLYKAALAEGGELVVYGGGDAAH